MFEGEFDATMESLKAAIHDNKADISISAMSEASKVINEMSMMSRVELPDSEFSMRETYEYVVVEGYIDIKMRESFVKYFSWCKRKGFNPLYTSADSFVSAMGKSPALVDRDCFDSPLRRESGALSKIFCFSLEQLTAERRSTKPCTSGYMVATWRPKERSLLSDG